MMLVQYLYVGNNAIVRVDYDGQKFILAWPGEIHEQVSKEIEKTFPNWYYEQRIVYHDGLGGFYGRADIISDTGAVYDIKSATDMAKNYRYKKAVNQIKRYVDPANTWARQPDAGLIRSVGTYNMKLYGCFHYDTQYVEYDVSYGYYQNGIITYEYTYHLKTEKVLAALKMAGIRVVVGGVCYFMPAAAPKTAIALGLV